MPKKKRTKAKASKPIDHKCDGKRRVESIMECILDTFLKLKILLPKRYDTLSCTSLKHIQEYHVQMQKKISEYWSMAWHIQEGKTFGKLKQYSIVNGVKHDSCAYENMLGLMVDVLEVTYERMIQFKNQDRNQDQWQIPVLFFKCLAETMLQQAIKWQTTDYGCKDHDTLIYSISEKSFTKGTQAT